ncbi:hypothetical protein C357_22910 [Citreicella sp. 357]|nr:hypothetical protein C357_22910 [Citreicella sp. 357]
MAQGFRDGDAHLSLSDLAIKVTRHGAQAQQRHAKYPLTGRVMRSMIPRGFVSTRLLRWYRLWHRHKARPKYRCALTASFRAIVPALVGFQIVAFLHGGVTA